MRFHLLWLLCGVIAAGQTITNFAGTGNAGFTGDNGPATQASINAVVGLAADAAGNVYLADQNNNRVRKVDTHGIITTIAGTGTAGFAGDGGLAIQAQLNTPTGVCVSPSGDIYINDLTNHRIRKITAGTGTITTVAGSGSALPGGDGGLAINAGMFLPIRCAVDAGGNLFIADQGAQTVRKVNTNGIISTFAGINNTAGFFGDGGPATVAGLNNPTAVSFDASGNLYVSDQFNHRIRKIDTNGVITTVAGNGNPTFAGDGGLATLASLNFPGETGFDGAGNLFIADPANEVIRKVSGGIISTVAGTHGVKGSSGDGGPPLAAQLNNPFPLTLDTFGNIYESDIDNNRVRKISGVASGVSNCTFAIATSGAAFPAAGGSGAVNVTTTSGCAWNTSGAPNWVTFTAGSGTGSGTASYTVAANSGPDRSGTVTVAGQTFTIEEQGTVSGTLSYIGSMPHIAAQENWTTSFTLVNKGANSATARLSLFGDPSGALNLPLLFPQTSTTALPEVAATLDRTIGANASLIVTSAGPQTPPVQIGSAQLSGTGAVDGFAIFHLIPGSQEAVVPMETRNASSYLLAYDNTGGVVLGVAVANVSAQAGTVGIVIRDDNGTQIGTGSLPMQASGHTSFVLSTQFPVTANKRGTIEFDTPPGGQISVLGIRTTPLGGSNTLTTIPALANVGTNGGSIAHIATGNGWQTTFVLVNTGTSAAQVNLNFFADVTGTPLSLPLSFPQTGTGSTATSVSQSLPAGASLLVQSAAPASNPAPTIGSAQLTTNGKVGGFVIFRYNPNGQEAVVPLESRTANGFIIAFDNTAGTATGIAINSVSSQAVNVPVIVRDDAGNQIASDTLNLAPNGHLAFTLVTDKYAATANIRGTIEFDTPPGGQIGALGIRIPVAHTFTTLPALSK
jgi:sugar lactone lactonase YvrE